MANLEEIKRRERLAKRARDEVARRLGFDSWSALEGEHEALVADVTDRSPLSFQTLGDLISAMHAVAEPLTTDSAEKLLSKLRDHRGDVDADRAMRDWVNCDDAHYDYQDVACPACGAESGQCCMTADGAERTNSIHRARLKAARPSEGREGEALR